MNVSLPCSISSVLTPMAHLVSGPAGLEGDMAAGQIPRTKYIRLTQWHLLRTASLSESDMVGRLHVPVKFQNMSKDYWRFDDYDKDKALRIGW